MSKKIYRDPETGLIDWSYGAREKQERIDNECMGTANEFGVQLMKPMALFSHQCKMTRWMMERCSKKHVGVLGGSVVLAPGLGKTLGSIHWIKMVQRQLKSPVLLIVEISLVDMWVAAIKQFMGKTLNFLVYTSKALGTGFTTYNSMFSGGGGKGKGQKRRLDIIITTYETVRDAYGCGTSKPPKASTASKARKPSKASKTKLNPIKAGPNYIPYQFLFGREWHAIIYDESDRLANWKSALFKAHIKLRKQVCFLLTATPVRNSEEDLWAQLRIIGYKLCPSHKQFTPTHWDHFELWKLYLVMDYDHPSVKVVLPPRIEHRMEIPFSPAEALLYKIMFDISQVLMDSFERGDSKFTDVLALFAKLRQISIAPYLIMSNMKKLRDKATVITDHRFHVSKQPNPLQQFTPTLLQSMMGEMKVSSSPTSSSSTSTSSASASAQPTSTIADRARVGLSHYFRQTYTDLFKDDPNTLNYICGQLRRLDTFMSSCGGDAGVGSSKMREAIRIIQHARTTREKTIVFSNFSSALEIMSLALDRTNIKHCVITGSIKEQDRAGILAQFHADPSVEVLLMTTRIGSKGHNITVATHEIFLDLHWCPSVQKQAMRRAHRIGQTRPVHVWWLVMAGSIEVCIERRGRLKDKITDCFFNYMGANDGESKVERKLPEKQTANVEMLREMFEETRAANQKYGDTLQQSNNSRSRKTIHTSRTIRGKSKAKTSTKTN